MSITNYLGLAKRAGKILVGTNLTIDGVRRNKVKLVILASDASNNTKKFVNDKCKTYNVKVIEKKTSKEISNAIGEKRSIMVLGIIDEGFSKLILSQKRK